MLAFLGGLEKGVDASLSWQNGVGGGLTRRALTHLARYIISAEASKYNPLNDNIFGWFVNIAPAHTQLIPNIDALTLDIETVPDATPDGPTPATATPHWLVPGLLAPAKLLDVRFVVTDGCTRISAGKAKFQV
jgi:hypothetical protein